MPKAKANSSLRKNKKERTRKNPKAAGRSTVFTKEVVEKLENAFSQGFNDSDAAILAGISREAIYDYCKRYPEFSTKKEALKRRPLLSSIVLINKAIREGDVNTAKWYAERKGKDEFSLRTETKEIDPVVRTTIVLTQEELDTAKEKLKNDSENQKNVKKMDPTA